MPAVQHRKVSRVFMPAPPPPPPRAVIRRRFTVRDCAVIESKVLGLGTILAGEEKQGLICMESELVCRNFF